MRERGDAHLESDAGDAAERIADGAEFGGEGLTRTSKGEIDALFTQHVVLPCLQWQHAVKTQA